MWSSKPGGGRSWERPSNAERWFPSLATITWVRGATEEEALRKVAEHAKEHGIVEVTPELMEKMKAAMHDE